MTLEEIKAAIVERIDTAWNEVKDKVDADQVRTYVQGLTAELTSHVYAVEAALVNHVLGKQDPASAATVSVDPTSPEPTTSASSSESPSSAVPSTTSVSEPSPSASSTSVTGMASNAPAAEAAPVTSDPETAQ